MNMVFAFVILISSLDASDIRAISDGGRADLSIIDVNKSAIKKQKKEKKPKVQVMAKLSKKEVKLAEPFYLIVEAIREEGQRINVSDPISDYGVSLIESPKKEFKSEQNKIKEIIRLKLAAFAIDDVFTPEFRLLIDQEEIIISKMSVNVLLSLDENSAKEGLSSENPPLKLLMFDDRPLAILAVLIVFIILLLFFSWLSSKRGPPPKKPKKLKPKVPIYVQALERMDKLEKSDYLKDKELEKFVNEAVNILRWYLGENYFIDTLDMTSTELHEALLQVLDPNLDVKVIAELINSSDFVKFAKAETTAQACAKLCMGIRDIINSTKKV